MRVMKAAGRALPTQIHELPLYASHVQPSELWMSITLQFKTCDLCMCVCVGIFFFQLDFCFQWTYGRWGASWERWSKAASSSRALIVSFTALAAGVASHRPQTSVWHAGLDKDMSLLICDPKHLLNHLNGVHFCSQHCVLD